MSVVILGAGISGLSAAFYLLKHTSLRVTVIEASSRIGGWISSHQHSDGFLFEQGARTLRPSGEAGLNTLKLIEDLQLPDIVNPIMKSHAAVKNRFVYVNGNLCPLPTSLISLFRTQPPFTKPLIYSVWNDLVVPPKITEDDSIYDFTARRFGQEVADYLISPLVCGICAGDAKKISVNFLFEKLFEKEQEYGSVIKGTFRKLNLGKLKAPSGKLPLRAVSEHWVLYTLKGGMQRLPNELGKFVHQNGGEILLNSTCEEINFRDKFIRISDDRRIKFDYLLSSVSANKLASLIKNDEKSLALDLEAIPYVSVATVNLAYKGKLLEKDGFGFLVPPDANIPLLGITFDSSYLDVGNNWTILTAMMGGFSFEKFFGKSPTEQMLLDTALKYVNAILNISDKPEHYKVSILFNCIPQYVVGHKKRVNNIHRYIENSNLPLSIIGSINNGVGVNDVILSSKKAVDRLNTKSL